MNRIGELYNKHENQTAIIMGSGPTLYDDLKQVTGDVVIACNHHALHLPHDYIVALDGAISGVAMCEIMRPYRDKFISPYKHYGRYHINMAATPTPDHLINTGIFACYVAKQLGCAKVNLCGMEFYQGEKTYFHNNSDVRDSNKTPEYKQRCVARLLDIDIEIGFNRLGL